MSRNRRSYLKVGSFTLSQPSMLVSDPCYTKNEWCAALVNGCKVGRWDSYVNMNRCVYHRSDGTNYNETRVASLFVKHESVSKEIFGTIHLEEKEDNMEESFVRWRGRWDRISDNICVDSGQAGFFDYEKYGDNSLFDEEGRCGFGDKWYSNCCDLTLDNDAGIVADCGVNASSGLGDGCYSVWGHMNRDDEIDAMVLFFLTDNERSEWM